MSDAARKGHSVDVGDILFRVDDLRGPEIAALLREHLDHAAKHSPPESVHALDLERLRTQDITFWTVWPICQREDGELLGCGALRQIDSSHGEIKSMHVAESHRGKGVAGRIIAHIVEEATKRGYGRLSLETGSIEGFGPARALYARSGFRPCPPFGEYRPDPYSVCMTMEL